jgi:choline dehydrogenase
VLQLRPESAGEIRLKSAEPREYPEIHPNYLATALDQQTIVEGIRVARRICRHEPVKDMITEEHAPGCAIADDDYDGLLNWARDTATTIYHPTGTCKMGKTPWRWSMNASRYAASATSAWRIVQSCRKLCLAIPMPLPS